MGDLERAVARIAATCADAVARDADAVVLYENAAKRRVQAFVAALKSLQALQVRVPPPESTEDYCTQPFWSAYLGPSGCILASNNRSGVIGRLSVAMPAFWALTPLLRMCGQDVGACYDVDDQFPLTFFCNAQTVHN